LLLAVATPAGIVAYMAHASGQSEGDSSPIYGVKIPNGYRDWQLIAVERHAGYGWRIEEYSADAEFFGPEGALPGTECTRL